MRSGDHNIQDLIELVESLKGLHFVLIKPKQTFNIIRTQTPKTIKVPSTQNFISEISQS